MEYNIFYFLVVTVKMHLLWEDEEGMHKEV